MSQNFLSIYAKSFNWAGFFLPQKIYKNSSDLYDFCRTLDNIADQDLKLDLKKKKFEEFKNEFQNKNFDNPIIEKIYILMERFEISPNIILDLFDGVESDLKEHVKFNSNKDLIIYSYRVAGTVGLMMAKILKVSKKNSLKSAIDLGIAMQLTNISRDVIEDSKNNRFYIRNNFEEISSTIKLADSFYKNSFYSINDIPISFRFSILVARRVYRKIGYKILDKRDLENYKNSGKIYVSNIEKTLETFLSIFDLIKLSLINKNNEQTNHNHLLIGEEIDINERI